MSEISREGDVFGVLSEGGELRRVHGPWQNNRIAVFRRVLFP